MDIGEFQKLPLMGILRGIDSRAISPLTKCIVSSGLKTVEIAMNTPDATELIREMVKLSAGRLTVGAGTVLTKKDLDMALSAGATFIVMPTLVRDVVEYCVKNSISVFTGALTPQEIYNAHCAGATMVKVFPAKFFGAAYFSQIKGPFNNIKLLACSGVTADNIASFFANGASAVAFGGSIFKKELIQKNEFSTISKSIKEIISAFVRYANNR